MRVLVGCECSGIVRDAFRARGHDAISADLKPCERPGPHYQGDVFDIIGAGWDLLIAHPPCTFLAYSGFHHIYTDPTREAKMLEAMAFGKRFLDADVEHIAVEQPKSALNRVRKHDQWLQPYEFGEDASKETWLWLKNLPKLSSRNLISAPPRLVNGKPRWANQTDNGHLRANNATDRSRTFPKIAEAMADQWGEYIRKHVK